MTTKKSRRDRRVHTTILIGPTTGDINIGCVEISQTEDGLIRLVIDNFAGGNREEIMINVLEAEAIQASLALAIKQIRNGGGA